MSSPFPGMDPYLETPALWPEFHHELVACLEESVKSGLNQRYHHRICQRRYLAEDSAFFSQGQPHCHEECLEIRQRSDDKLVTHLDVVSLANKLTPAGRQAYLHTRQQAKDANASLVEIDLVTQGKPMLDYSREGLPDWHQSVTITRATQPERYEIYTATVQKKLPKFRAPLAADDRDIVLDLQAIFSQAYEKGSFAGKIDYKHPPIVPFRRDDAHWLQNLLGLSQLPNIKTPSVQIVGKSDHDFPHEAIAAVAYQLWDRDGRLPSRDQHYWYNAIELLRRGDKTC